MINYKILNPAVLDLIAKVRHTNTLVISDKGFPFWPQIETIDISLTDDIPSVNQVLEVLLEDFIVGKVWMAEQFKEVNSKEVVAERIKILGDVEIKFEDHDEFKKRVPNAIGLIRTGGVTSYSNIIVESA